MKQTAVKWLFEQLPKKLHSHYKKQLDQAKAMEKKQIIDFAEDYEINESEKYPQKTFEQYYNETFK